MQYEEIYIVINYGGGCGREFLFFAGGAAEEKNFDDELVYP